MMMIHPASFLFILIHLLSRVAPYLTPPTPFPYQIACPDQVSDASNE
jgi:hypothetical protein